MTVPTKCDGNLSRTIRIDVRSPTRTETEADGRSYTVLVDAQDVTGRIRSAEVDRHVSVVSRHPGVRTELIRQQRLIGQRGRMVMVGRDIGTVVFPDAPTKIYLETSLEERARRRFADLRSTSPSLSLEQVGADLARRDALDDHVLFPANDALIMHTDTCSPAEEVERIMALFDGGTVPMSRPEHPGG
ncbi:MAG: cytidylate kinase [Chloroflexaceae bacterium]|nr:cytidylate kinase [Chloroflexaceae bacterium]